MESDCLFCRIAAGELPADVVRADDHFVAIRDIAPKADVHVLVLPRHHAEHLDDFLATGGDTAALTAFASATAADLGVAGAYRLVANVGRAAGQEVPHLHLHLMAGPSLPGF